jgi:hypothetical protein
MRFVRSYETRSSKALLSLLKHAANVCAAESRKREKGRRGLAEMKRIRIKLSEGTEAHLDVLTDDLLEGMQNKSVRELKWIIREAFTEGIIHCADLHLTWEAKQKRLRMKKAHDIT